ncbi:hypothetical protein RQP46_008702 [Phenoliferia psychrophenolica]
MNLGIDYDFKNLAIDADGEVIECAVCLDEETKAFKLPSSNCTHFPDVCAGCLAAFLQTEIQTNGNVVIHCSTILSYEDVRNLAGRDDFERFDALLLRAAIGGSTNFYHCQSPGCGSIQEHVGGSEGGQIMICATCGGKTCVFHQLPWHSGQTCKEFDQATKSASKASKARV